MRPFFTDAVHFNKRATPGQRARASANAHIVYYYLSRKSKHSARGKQWNRKTTNKTKELYINTYATSMSILDGFWRHFGEPNRSKADLEADLDTRRLVKRKESLDTLAHLTSNPEPTAGGCRSASAPRHGGSAARPRRFAAPSRGQMPTKFRLESAAHSRRCRGASESRRGASHRISDLTRRGLCVSAMLSQRFGGASPAHPRRLRGAFAACRGASDARRSISASGSRRLRGASASLPQSHSQGSLCIGLLLHIGVHYI